MDNTEIENQIVSWLSTACSRTDPAFTSANEMYSTLGSTRGLVRDENQDRVIAMRFSPGSRAGREVLFYGLCDGIGGGTHGGACAELTLATVCYYLATSDEFDIGVRLVNAVKEANSKVYNLYKTAGGTTFTGLAFSPNGRMHVVNVGDSRLYSVQSLNSAAVIKKITEDDTVAGEIAKLRGHSLSEHNYSHLSNQLTQFVGVGEDIAPHHYTNDFVLSEDAFLLTSDGGHFIGDDLLHEMVENSPTEQELVKRLVTISKWLGGNDKASVIYVSPGASKKISRLQYKVDIPTLSLWTAGDTLRFVSEQFYKVRTHKVVNYDKNENSALDSIQDDEKKAIEKVNKKIAATHKPVEGKGRSRKKTKVEQKREESEKKQLDISLETTEDVEKDDGSK